VRKLASTYKILILITCTWQVPLLLSSTTAKAQAPKDTIALYISPTASLYVNGKSGVAIFSNVINSGIFGTAKGTTVNMLGDIWRNTPNASFPDEWGTNNPNAFTGIGGDFRFAGITNQQYLVSGFSLTSKTGPFFPNIVIANARGMYLLRDDAQVRGTLNFEIGLLNLNGNNLVVGQKDPGSIAGYDENRFVATGNTSQGGYLYRSRIASSSGSVVFPVGTQAGSYAPLSVMFNSTKPQDLHVRVFDNIYRNAFAGPTGSPASVQQSWNMGQEDTSTVPAIVAIQHMGQHEGAAFTSHRGNSYVSMYDFTLRTWDTLGPSGVTTPGTITTGTPRGGTYINTRILNSIAQTTYLTKTADTRTDSITLSKAALTPVRQPDGSFLVSYMFLVRNTGRLMTTNLKVLDTLDKVFTAPSTFSVVSVTTSGNLVPNKMYDGIAVTDLLLPVSTLAPLRTDTITLTVNVITNRRDGYYYNNASVQGTMTGANGRTYVIDNRSVNGMVPPDPATPSLPTPIILSESKYQLPQGFSPNGDGINDRFVIGSLGSNTASLWIFNKQGILLYRNMNYKNEWDGISNEGGPLSNRKVDDGTYFYKAVITETATGKSETYYGFISIWK
jgi:gliding motility-associated-like protein